MLVSKVVRSSQAMKNLGAMIARNSMSGDVIFLSGDLGAGKTQFSCGFVRELVGDEHLKVPSPSFLLDNTYTSNFERSKNVM